MQNVFDTSCCSGPHCCLLRLLTKTWQLLGFTPRHSVSTRTEGLPNLRHKKGPPILNLLPSLSWFRWESFRKAITTRHPKQHDHIIQMSSTTFSAPNQPEEPSFPTDDGRYPPESFWTKQDEERPAMDQAEREAANQVVLKQQLTQLEEAKQFAIHTLGKTENRASAEQALATWYVRKYGEKLRTGHITEIVREAALALRPKSEGKRKGERIDTTEAPWLWEGMVMEGQFNLVVGAPKVGKSALITAMIGALARGDGELLGRPLAGKCPPVIVIGTDQPYTMWAQLFSREQLISREGELLDPIERLMAAGDGLVLDNEGLDRIQAMAEEHPGALILLDSYDSLAGPLGVEEASALFARPARLLIDRLAPTGATWVVLHHTNKSVSGGSAISASRGSNALPAAASWCLLLNWLKAPPEGQTQTDFRAMVTGQGRARGSQMLCQLTGDGADCHWEALGDPKEVITSERTLEAEMNIGEGRQADALDYLRMRYELGNFPVTSKELAGTLNVTQAKANRYLNQLVGKGLALIWKSGFRPANGRPADLFVYHLGDFSGENIALNGNVGEILELVQEPPRARIKEGGLSPISSFPSSHSSYTGATVIPRQGEQPPSTDAWGGEIPFVPTKVEVRSPDGAWANGWVLQGPAEGLNPHALTVERFGNASLTKSGLRWGEDVRLCQAITTTQPEIF